MHTSFFEIFKIGIGPSSSHTMGPLRAAREFSERLRDQQLTSKTSRVQIELYGSLAMTGKGHCTDRALVLGLLGEHAESINPEAISEQIRAVVASRTLRLLGKHEIVFSPESDIVFRKGESQPDGPNAMRFNALDADGKTLFSELCYSIGGGFLRREGESANAVVQQAPAPYDFHNAAELLQMCRDNGFEIWRLALANECAWRSQADVLIGVDKIWATMEGCIERGLRAGGVLPGGLNVQRRAKGLYARLEGEEHLQGPLAPLDLVDAAAMAVSEENAAGSRVVTAPTNGAAGIIPAVGYYLTRMIPGADQHSVRRYLLTAGVIGALYKENASISGAEVGCQGEVGVACSMAAGALTAALGGDAGKVEHAAEMAMEHNLGATCDPVAGLVQIPCIERNAMGAVRAINCARIAMKEPNEHKVSLDQIIETMYRTGLDMQSRYKETSLGGLALNILQC